MCSTEEQPHANRQNGGAQEVNCKSVTKCEEDSTYVPEMVESSREKRVCANGKSRQARRESR